MHLIDTHCHIYSTEFNGDRQAMVDRATAAGVGTLLMPAIDSTTHESMLLVEQDNPGVCIPMMGLHPCSVKDNYKDELSLIRDYLSQRNFIAVGEIGLDYYWDLTFKDQQVAAFHQQIEWAMEFDIPIVIHSRESTNECIEIVAQHQQGKLKGVFHCFSGSVEQAHQITTLGFYLGIGGVVTFKNGGLDKVMQQVGLDHVVLETDAPYLAPVPFRGKRNECAYTQLVAQKLATIRQLDIAEVAAITTANAKKLFALPGVFLKSSR